MSLLDRAAVERVVGSTVGSLMFQTWIHKRAEALVGTACDAAFAVHVVEWLAGATKPAFDSSVDVLEAFLAPPGIDPKWTGDVVDLAIQLCCCDEVPFAEYVAGAAAWVLYASRGHGPRGHSGLKADLADACQRARRMLNVVGIKFPAEKEEPVAKKTKTRRAEPLMPDNVGASPEITLSRSEAQVTCCPTMGTNVQPTTWDRCQASGGVALNIEPREIEATVTLHAGFVELARITIRPFIKDEMDVRNVHHQARALFRACAPSIARDATMLFVDGAPL